jgi:mRNA interferase RelE/StbE
MQSSFICVMPRSSFPVSRIKRLRELHSPQYRLRVDDWRVFYDVVEGEVRIRGVVRKPDASEWLAQFGEPS